MSKILTILIIVLSTQFSLNLSAECIKGNCANQQSTYNYTDGSKYIGEYKDGTRHGQGTYNHASGDQYIGEWKYSKMHGQGTYTFANGNKYIGEFKDDEKHGQGTYTWSDGRQYSGEWKNGKRHGQGTISFGDGGSEGGPETGIWENDKYIGRTAAEIEQERINRIRQKHPTYKMTEREKRIYEEEQQEIIEKANKEEEKRIQKRDQYINIRNNCLIDYSKDVDMTVSSIERAVEHKCEEIAYDPSFYERWKYE